MRRLLGPIAAVALLLTLALPVAASDHGKVTLCHATNSLDNPYVQIEISQGGLNGHKTGEDLHFNSKTGLPDFLLSDRPEQETCDDVPDDLEVTPLAPGVSGATCEAAGVLTLTEVEGVAYTIDPEYEVGDSGAFTVTAEAEEGFTIAEDADAEFDVSVAAKLNCAAGLAPSVSGATCAAPGALTLNAVTGVSYNVNPAYAAGASGSFTVTAVAGAGVTLTGPTVFVVNVPAKLVCNDGTLGGNPAPTVRAGTLGSVPNTAMDGPASSQAPVAMIALLVIAGVAYVGHRNLVTIKGRR